MQNRGEGRIVEHNLLYFVIPVTGVDTLEQKVEGYMDETEEKDTSEERE